MTDLLHLGQAYGAVDCANYALISLREHLMMLDRRDLADQVRDMSRTLIRDIARELEKMEELNEKKEEER